MPIRQWVLSLPWELRRLAAFNAEVLTALGRIFVEAVFAEQKASAGVQGALCGAVDFPQRFGGSLNLNLHFRVLVLDGERATLCLLPWARGGRGRTRGPSFGED